jgi:hypothetical protein
VGFVVLYDANVLYPSTSRDLLIRIAQARLVQAKWTGQIMDEVFDNLRENLITGLDLPDPDDRHVLAAAIRARAQVIVTNNLKDFPPGRLARWDIEPKSADEFVLDQIDLNAKVVWGCVQQIADTWRNPPGTTDDVLRSLERDGLLRAVAELESR